MHMSHLRMRNKILTIIGKNNKYAQANIFNLLRSDFPWQAEYISTNVSQFYTILVKCTYVLDFAL